jgi:2-methylisocitrate lyase-like PEP mutase family enzyme
VVAAVAPKPVNVLVSSAAGFTVADLAAGGVRRISVGGGLARVAWHAFMQATRELVDGRFDGFATAASGAELNRFFADDLRRRSS